MVRKIFFIFTLIFLATFSWLNYSSWQCLLFLGVTIFYYWQAGYIMAAYFFADSPKIIKSLLAPLLIIMPLTIIGAALYLLYKIDNYTLLFIHLIPFLISSLLIIRTNILENELFSKIETISNNLFKSIKFSSWIIFLTIILLFFSSFYLLIINPTFDSILSPWQKIPVTFFISYFLTWLAILSFWKREKNLFLTILLAIIQIFLSCSIVLFTYPLGFGFDPFIHQATEKLIAAQGVVYPKPFYYLGQYFLVVFGSKFFYLPIVFLDRMLVPLLVSINLPLIIYLNYRKISGSSNLAFLTILLAFIIPFTSFTNTTPQGLANFFALATIFFSLSLIKNFSWRQYLLVVLGTLTTLTIHPLAGLPLFIFTTIIFFKYIFSKIHSKLLKNLVWSELVIILSVLIPLVFIINSKISGQLNLSINQLDWNVALNLFNDIKNYFSLFYQTHFNFNLDLVYLFANNFWLIFTAIIIVGFFINRKNQLYQQLSIYWLTFIILVINYALLKYFVVFTSLIDYERNIYAARILELAFFFLIPVFIMFILNWYKARLEDTNFRTVKFAANLGLCALLSCSLYLSYPRQDLYGTNHGYNVSATDLKTVNFINNDAKDADYIVLANQMVSAAAINEYGFKKYFEVNYNGKKQLFFYYPIPTGDPLYQYFLKIVEGDVKKEYVEQAMKMFGVKKAYFVTNSYWWKSKELNDKLKSITNTWYTIDNGKNIVYSFELE